MKKMVWPGLLLLVLIAIALYLIPFKTNVSLSSSTLIYQDGVLSEEEQATISIEGSILHFLFQSDRFEGKITLNSKALEARYGSQVIEFPDQSFKMITFAAFDSEGNGFQPVNLVMDPSLKMAALWYKNQVYLCNPQGLETDALLTVMGIN